MEEEIISTMYPIIVGDKLIGECIIKTNKDNSEKLDMGLIVILPEVQEHIKTKTLKLLGFQAVMNTMKRDGGYIEDEEAANRS